MGFPENWFEDLIKQFPVELQLAGIAINHALTPERITPLLDKWLGALFWYGQGVSESSYAARIVKYVAALEQLTMTKKSNNLDVTQTVTSRTRFLCGALLEEDKKGNTRSLIDNMYKHRCDLIHGRISPSDPIIHATAQLSERITQQALFTALRMFSYISSERSDSLEELEKEYDLQVRPEEYDNPTKGNNSHSTEI